MTSAQAFKVAIGLLGAFLAAVGVGIVLGCGYALVPLVIAGKELESPVGDALLFIAANAAYFSAVIAFLAIALIALPHVIISHHLRQSSRKYYLVSGIAIGLLVVVIVGIWQRLRPGPPFHIGSDEYFFTFSAVSAGAVAALTYWKIARPDKLRHQSPPG